MPLVEKNLDSQIPIISAEELENLKKEKQEKIEEDISNINIEEADSPNCESCKKDKAEFYCDITDASRCSEGASGKRYFCGNCSSSTSHNDHAPKEMSQFAINISNEWLDFLYQVKDSIRLVQTNLLSKD